MYVKYFISNYTICIYFCSYIIFSRKKTNKKKEVIITKEMPLIDYVEHTEFFEDAEKKLIALKELYRQELIDKNMYVKKTELIAQSILKLTGKNVRELVETKDEHIYKRLKNNISEKIEKIPSKKHIGDLDKLISDVDKKIKMGLNYER